MPNIHESPILRIGISAEKDSLFEGLVEAFHALHGHREDYMQIHITPVQDASALMSSALEGEFDAISPDSTIWLDELELRWQEQNAGKSLLVSEYTVFAVSPVVIVMRASRACQLEYPHRSIGWVDLAELAASDDIRFTWSHPAPRDSGAGLLAALAEFYAGAGKGDQLTEEDLVREDVARFVRELEGSISEYGISATEVAKRAIQEGQWRVDAFVTEEHIALDFLQAELDDPPVIVYPKEGTLWAEHALALCLHDLRTSVRTTYDAFREYLVSADGQGRILAGGFHPAGPHYQAYLATVEHRPLAGRHVMPEVANAFSTPATTVHMFARTAWWDVKKLTNVYLVADISGSMVGSKLSNAQRGLEAFVSYFRSDEECVGLVAFDHKVQQLIPSDVLSKNRDSVLNAIAALRPGGRTALLDAIAIAYEQLQRSDHVARNQAIVVMTDGLENASCSVDRLELLHRIEAGRNSNRIAIFCIAYGDDADRDLLRQIALASGGSIYEGTLANIYRTYGEISRFF